MTRDEMYTMSTELTQGRTMNTTLWDQLANAVKNVIEAKRPWVILKKEDSSISISGATTYTTANNLPADFQSFINVNEARKRYPVRLVSGKEVIYLTEEPYERRHELQDADARFFVDYANSQIYFSGARNKTYTVYLSYFRYSPDIASGADWVFPSRFHAIIPLLVTGANKGGVDYDQIMREMSPDNRAVAETIMTAMDFWDAKLQQQAAGV